MECELTLVYKNRGLLPTRRKTDDLDVCRRGGDHCAPAGRLWPYEALKAACMQGHVGVRHSVSALSVWELTRVTKQQKSTGFQHKTTGASSLCKHLVLSAGCLVGSGKQERV